jgi:transcriptional regulator of arginine metabolism
MYNAHEFAKRPTTMPSDHEHRIARQQEVLALLDTHRVTSQTELVDLLRERGITATQSSVSRDLRDLGVAWIDGRYARPQRNGGDPDVAEFARFVRAMKPAGPNLTVILTAVGTAQSVALAIDRAGWPELVGTMAGDDTVFAATASARDQKRLIQRIESFLKEE